MTPTGGRLDWRAPGRTGCPDRLLTTLLGRLVLVQPRQVAGRPEMMPGTGRLAGGAGLHGRLYPPATVPACDLSRVRCGGRTGSVGSGNEPPELIMDRLR